MYVILIDDDNRLVETAKARIMQRSKLVDDLWFLTKPSYNEYDMTDFTVSLEYVAPVSKKYHHEILTLSDEPYNGYLKYTLPIDTAITAEAGDVELQITFILAELGTDGRSVQRVRKANGASITVCPITAWSDIIPDDALSALDQRIIKTDAQIKALADFGNALDAIKADNISYDKVSNELQLISNGTPIGDKVSIVSGGTDLKDGVPVVDFERTNTGEGDDPPSDTDIIEF